MKILIMAALLPLSFTAQAASWPENMSHYQGLRCLERTETHRGHHVRIVELRYTGHDALDGDGKPYRAFDLISTPSYLEESEAPAPQVVQKDLGISNLAERDPRFLEATSQNFHDKVAPWRVVSTSQVQKTYLDSAGGGLSTTTELVWRSGVYQRNGHDRAEQEFRFYPGDCAVIP